MEIKCQLDATEVFIADLIACSTCFGHHYAHYQELKSIIQWLLPVDFHILTTMHGQNHIKFVLMTVDLRTEPPVYQKLLVEHSRGLDRRQRLSLIGAKHL